MRIVKRTIVEDFADDAQEEQIVATATASHAEEQATEEDAVVVAEVQDGTQPVGGEADETAEAAEATETAEVVSEEDEQQSPASQTTEQIKESFGIVIDESEGDDAAAEADGTGNATVFDAVLIQAGLSKNDRMWTPEALQEATSKFNTRSFIDHSMWDAMGRSPRDVCGFFRRAQWDATIGSEGGVRAKFHVLKASPVHDIMVQAVKEGAKDLFGLSVVAMVDRHEEVKRGGRAIVVIDKIKEVLSEDVVAFPAAGGKLSKIIAESIGSAEQQTAAPVAPVTGVQENTEQLSEGMNMEENEKVVKAVAEDTSTAETKPTGALDGVLDEINKTKADLAAERNALALERCSAMLDRKMAASGLPAKFREMVESEFRGKVYEAGDLDARIATLQTAFSESVKQYTRMHISVGENDASKFQKRLDGMLLGKDVDGIPRYKSILWAYANYRGVPEMLEGDRSKLAEYLIHDSLGLRVPLEGSVFSEAISWATLFGTALHRKLINDYALPAFEDWRALTSNITSLSDFKEHNVIRTGFYGVLPVVAEAAAYTDLVSPDEEPATYQAAKYGGLESWTWEAAINDDIGALSLITKRLALSAKYTIFWSIFNLLATNAVTTYDSTALFNAAHNNVGTAALSSNALSAARVAMRSQPAMNGNFPLSIIPKYLIVPNTLEYLGSKLRNSPVEVTGSNDGSEGNPHFGSFEMIVVDMFTDTNNWYMMADPLMCPTFEVGFLEGREEPEIMMEAANSGQGFTNDIIRLKTRIVFGVVVVDHRGFYGSLVAGGSGSGS